MADDVIAWAAKVLYEHSEVIKEAGKIHCVCGALIPSTSIDNDHVTHQAGVLAAAGLLRPASSPRDEVVQVHLSAADVAALPEDLVNRVLRNGKGVVR